MLERKKVYDIKIFFHVIQIEILSYQLIFGKTLQLCFGALFFLHYISNFQNLASWTKQVFLNFIYIFTVYDFLC